MCIVASIDFYCNIGVNAVSVCLMPSYIIVPFSLGLEILSGVV